MNNIIHGFVILDKVPITIEYREMLSQLMREYLMEFRFIKEIDERELYYLVMRDRTRIEDKTTEIEDGSEFTQYGLLTTMTTRNPEIIGIWEKDGVSVGMTKVVTPMECNEEGEVISEEIIDFIGKSTYEFKKDLYMSYMDDIVVCDEEGNELSREKPTELKPIRLFSGYDMIFN